MNPELREKAIETLKEALEHEDWRIRLSAAKFIVSYVGSPEDGRNADVPLRDKIAQRDAQGSGQRGTGAFGDAGED